MTEEQARKIASIVINADGGCIHCVVALTMDLQREFPEHNWFALVAEATDGDWTEQELRKYNAG